MHTEPIQQTDACIVGGGPAGMMLGLFLARRGVRVQLLEVQKDFDRDFRGDTVHPSTLNILQQLDLADRVLALPHGRIRQLRIITPERTITPVDFSVLGGKFPFTAIMPQVDFLNFILAEADRSESFHLATGCGVTGLLKNASGEVTGVQCRTAAGEHEVRARVVIAADGRFSKLRKLSGLPVERRSPPMDVCWFRLSRHQTDPEDAGAFYINHGRMLVCIPRAEDWQFGYAFPKGNFSVVREAGFAGFQAALAQTAPWLENRLHEIESFDDLHLLRVESNCLTTWHVPGLLLIGDAAHAMSPVGGVGINAAIADAVATANRIGPHLLGNGHITEAVLAQVQLDRALITRIIQTAQAAMQRVIVQRALQNKPFQLPLPARVITRTPGLRALPPRTFAIGVRQPVLTF